MIDTISTLHNIRTEMRDLLTKHIAFDAYCISTVDPLTLLPTGALTSSSIEFIHDQLLRNEYVEKDNVAKILHIDKPNETRLKDILNPANIGDELRFPLFFKGSVLGHHSLIPKNRGFEFYRRGPNSTS